MRYKYHSLSNSSLPVSDYNAVICHLVSLISLEGNRATVERIDTFVKHTYVTNNQHPAGEIIHRSSDGSTVVFLKIV